MRHELRPGIDCTKTPEGAVALHGWHPSGSIIPEGYRPALPTDVKLTDVDEASQQAIADAIAHIPKP